MPPRTSRTRPHAPEAAAVADRLHAIAIHLLRRVRAEDVGIGLTGPRASALSVLVYRGPISISALAALEQVRAPTMSRAVAALVKAGLARSARDRDDGRVHLLWATPKGQRLLEEGRRRRVRALAILLERLPARDRRTIHRAVRLLEAVVQVPAASA